MHAIKRRTTDVASSCAPSPMSLAGFAPDAYALSSAGVHVMPPAQVFRSNYTLDQACALDDAVKAFIDDSRAPAYDLSVLAHLALLNIWVPFLRSGHSASVALQSSLAAAQGLVGLLKSFSSPKTSVLSATLALISPRKILFDTIVVLAHGLYVPKRLDARVKNGVLDDLNVALSLPIVRKNGVVDAIRRRVEGRGPTVQRPSQLKRKHDEVDYTSGMSFVCVLRAYTHSGSR